MVRIAMLKVFKNSDTKQLRLDLKNAGLKATVRKGTGKYPTSIYVKPRAGQDVYKLADFLDAQPGLELHPFWEKARQQNSLHIGTPVHICLQSVVGWKRG